MQKKGGECMTEHFDPRKQFSKKLASRAEWFWFGYMVLVAAVAAYSPESAKGLFAAEEIAKIKFSWRSGKTAVNTGTKDSDDVTGDEDDDEDETSDDDPVSEDGVSNG